MLIAIWNFLKDDTNRAVLGWIGGGVLAVITTVTGGAWTVYRWKRVQQNRAGSRQSDALQVRLGSGLDFEHVQPRLDYVIRTISFCIENTDTSSYLSNCKVYAEFNGVNQLLIDTFTLLPREKRFVPIVVHHEYQADKFIHVVAPRASGFFAEAFNYLKLPLTGTIITIRATCSEARPAQQVCRAFVDEAGKLKLENA